MTLDDLRTPALVLDLDRLEANLGWMQDRADALGVALRPHVKTHKCVEIARRQLDLGARGVTVSTLYEASVLADHGFADITWAFPVIPNRIPEARAIAERTTLRLVVDTPHAVDALEREGGPFPIWLKVDCGYHRAGVDPKSENALALARRLADSTRLTFEGILSHSGHAYDAPTDAARAAVAEEERDVMVRFAERLQGDGIDGVQVSVGSTPSMRSATQLEGVTEARPGNYALFDFFQSHLGTCTPREIAATVLTTVVSSQPGASHAVTDSGALAMSRDPGPAGRGTWGEVFADYEAGILDGNLRLVGLSQEHGKLSRAVPPGTRLRIAPNHACLTVSQFDTMFVARGDEVIDQWRIWRGRD